VENHFCRCQNIEIYDHFVDDSVWFFRRSEGMYTPHAGRWLSQDPAGFVDGPNRYLYVTNNSVNRYDPSGLQCEGHGPWTPSMCNDCPPCTCDAVHDPANGIPSNYPLAELGRGIAEGLFNKNPIKCNIQFRVGDCGLPEGSARTCGRFFPINPERNQRTIFICVQQGTSRCTARALLFHELSHAKELCNQKDDRPNLTADCTKSERAAYESSCAVNLAQRCISTGADNYKDMFNKCVADGITTSCVTLLAAATKDCDQTIDTVFGGGQQQGASEVPGN
jgi:hypothetical protein